MTIDKMPDVINITVSKNAVGVKDYQVSKLRPNTRYLRAEPVEELLKNAWEALDNIAGDMYDDSEIRPILTAIDKFLGDE